MFKKLLQILLMLFIVIVIITGLVILFKSMTDPMYCLPFSENGICGDGKY
jgi:cytochrome b subunit of formate dehydrogenase